MFCPTCGRQNKENTVFCAFCGKAMTQKNLAPNLNQPISQENNRPQKTTKVRVSFKAKKAIVTGVLIVGLVIVVLLIYYPSIFPWNW
jgi:uncharacterized membrane protein YvbJ